MPSTHSSTLLLGLVAAMFALASGGCSDDATATGGAGGSSSTTSGTAGAGGSGCVPSDCVAPGEVCTGDSCELDCRRASANPCAAGTVCDVSDANPGRCVDPATACVTTSEPEVCGDKTCGPGSACTGDGKCYPRVPCNDIACDAEGCWGAACACERTLGCSPAPLGTPGESGTLHDDTFRQGLIDLEFDPTCGAWGVTLISGADYLRNLTKEGVVATYAGVTNLNMGEVSVLQQITIPKSATTDDVPSAPPPPADGLDVALTYICCATCGCQLASTPQGVARYEEATSTLPLVVPSDTFTTGVGPFAATVIDTGPAGLTYGTDRVLYVGNVDINGDYYRLDLATATQTLVTTFASRVYASTPFDAVRMLVALEGGELRLMKLADGTSTLWATSESPVIGLVRDFFDGAVYLARRDGQLWRYDESGQGALFQTAMGPTRLSIAQDGFLYGLELAPPFADTLPKVVRWPLPMTR